MISPHSGSTQGRSTASRSRVGAVPQASNRNAESEVLHVAASALPSEGAECRILKARFRLANGQIS